MPTPAPSEPRTPAGAEAKAAHARRVARVADQLRHRKSTAPLSRRKRVVSHQVPKVHDKKYSDDKIDLFDLDQIIEIDPERRLCIAEPGVPFRPRQHLPQPLPEDLPRSDGPRLNG